MHRSKILMVLCHSDKTSKHFELQCLHRAKEMMHLGGTDYFWERIFILTHEWSVFGEIWAFTGEPWCYAKPPRLFWQKHQECWECLLCFKKWAKDTRTFAFLMVFIWERIFSFWSMSHQFRERYELLLDSMFGSWTVRLFCQIILEF